MNTHYKDILKSALFPTLFVVLLWVIYFIDNYFELYFVRYGLYPRRFSGVVGIFTAPLLHGSSSHLLSNTIPLLILGWIMFYMYRTIAFPIFFWTYFMTGVWVWVGGRDAYHIGASGLVYAFVCFLFFSGIFRFDKRFLALSLLVTFIYGGLVWGVFPLRERMSWESHLLGSIAGAIVAYNFRKEGPQKEKYEWEDEPDEESTAETTLPAQTDKPNDTGTLS